jgi:hypothetical protein
MNGSQQLEVERNRAILKQLESKGYEFSITANGYFVSYKGKGVGGASVKLPRSKPLHYKHREANLKENLQQAVIFALKHNKEVSNEHI